MFDIKLIMPSKKEPVKIEFNDDGTIKLHQAASEGALETVLALIHSGVDINIPDDIGNTPLHLAAWRGHTKVVNYLAMHRADLEAMDEDGDTALNVAVHNGHLETVRTLLLYNVRIMVADKLGNRPLHWAARKGYLDIVKLLVAHQANIHVKNQNDKTAVELAFENGCHEVVAYLQQQGAYLPSHSLLQREKDILTYHSDSPKSAPLSPELSMNAPAIIPAFQQHSSPCVPLREHPGSLSPVKKNKLS